MNRLAHLSIIVLAYPLVVLADSSQCGFITDSDQRAYCRATSGDGESHCGFIQNDDLRALCRAEASGRQSECGFIRDDNKRALCRAKIHE